MRRTARLLHLFAGMALLSPLGTARAELGGRVESVEADRVHLAAHAAHAIASTHSTYTLEPDAGGAVVHEYVTPDGTVFAVTWAGQGRPDLRQLLGAHFATFQQDSAARGPGRLMRRHVAVSRPEMVVHSSGHPGAFAGVAYLPQLVPAGFDLQGLQ